MKKIFLLYWETIWYAIIMAATLIVALQVMYISWPNDAVLMGLLVVCVLYACVVLILFVQQPMLRRAAHFVHCIIVVVFLLLVRQSGIFTLYRAGFAFSLLFYAIIGFSIARASIWLYKRHQAKKVETEHD